MNAATRAKLGVHTPAPRLRPIMESAKTPQGDTPAIPAACQARDLFSSVFG